MPKKQRTIKVLGAMSGTSCDGLDLSLVEFSSASWIPTWSASLPYPKKLRDRVLAVQKANTKISLEDLSALDRDLGIWYGKAFQSVIRSFTRGNRPDLLSNHGQTIGHFPFLKGGGTTVQIGDPNHIVQETGITVVSHHRYGDMAGGGQGAPFVPSFHALVAASVLPVHEGIAIHNLGGISNFTYLGKNGKILASDTGPANLWIDESVRWLTRGKKAYDAKGIGAREGEIDPKVLIKMLKHPFLGKPFPKSTGRDDFTVELLMSYLKGMKREAILPTVTAFTVESIARAYEREVLKKRLPLHAILLAGGGTKNETLVSWLQHRLDPIRVETIEAHGLESQYLESQAFAYLGYRSVQGWKLGGPWTGGENSLSGGRITPGKNWKTLLDRLP